MNKVFSVMALWLSTTLLAEGSFHLEVGKKLPELRIAGEHGGNVADRSAWTSASMLGKLHFIVYVDPDDHDLNDELATRLEAKKYPEDILDSVAIINLAATWKPNAIILSVLSGKQKQFPLTTYVYDKDRYLAQQWDLAPDGYHVLLLDKDGTVLFAKAGKFSSSDVDGFLDLVGEKISSAQNTSKQIAQPEKVEPKKAL